MKEYTDVMKLGIDVLNFFMNIHQSYHLRHRDISKDKLEEQRLAAERNDIEIQRGKKIIEDKIQQIFFNSKLFCKL